jgi:ferric-dicitrate binding protein FerR (iron transport regulator)
LNNNSSHIDNLIARYLAGEASDNEREELLLWMDRSPENKKYFEGIRFVHDKAVSSHRIVKVDVDKAWQKLSLQMDDPALQKTSEIKSIPVYRKTWFRLAASVVLLLGLTLTFLLLNRTERTIENYSLVTTDTIQTHTIAGTGITLNRNSSLNFSLKKTGRKQEIELSGEAFLEVSHSSDTILIVRAGTTFIKDIGTSFNVKAYPEHPTIEVYVENGEVIFYTSDNTGITLKAGETGIFDKNEKRFYKPDAVDINAIAYKSKLFVFRDTPLSKAIQALNSVYNRKYELANPELGNCTITVIFDSESPEAIADVISETLGLQVSEQPDKFVLDGVVCSGQP